MEHTHNVWRVRVSAWSDWFAVTAILFVTIFAKYGAAMGKSIDREFEHLCQGMVSVFHLSGQQSGVGLLTSSSRAS